MSGVQALYTIFAIQCSNHASLLLHVSVCESFYSLILRSYNVHKITKFTKLHTIDQRTYVLIGSALFYSRAICTLSRMSLKWFQKCSVAKVAFIWPVECRSRSSMSLTCRSSVDIIRQSSLTGKTSLNLKEERPSLFILIRRPCWDFKDVLLMIRRSSWKFQVPTYKSCTVFLEVLNIFLWCKMIRLPVGKSVSKNDCLHR